jgi:hypothetical protein
MWPWLAVVAVPSRSRREAVTTMSLSPVAPVGAFAWMVEALGSAGVALS